MRNFSGAQAIGLGISFAWIVAACGGEVVGRTQSEGAGGSSAASGGAPAASGGIPAGSGGALVLGSGGTPPVVVPPPDGGVVACAAPPNTGFCDKYTSRYRFDPARGQCVGFVGCGGDGNDFETYDLCASVCLHVQPVTCVCNSGPCADPTCADCPADLTSATSATRCDTPGLSCGNTHSDRCDCVVDSDLILRWRCGRRVL